MNFMAQPCVAAIRSTMCSLCDSSPSRTQTGVVCSSWFCVPRMRASRSWQTLSIWCTWPGSQIVCFLSDQYHSWLLQTEYGESVVIRSGNRDAGRSSRHCEHLCSSPRVPIASYGADLPLALPMGARAGGEGESGRREVDALAERRDWSSVCRSFGKAERGERCISSSSSSGWCERWTAAPVSEVSAGDESSACNKVTAQPRAASGARCEALTTTPVFDPPTLAPHRLQPSRQGQAGQDGLSGRQQL